MLMLKSITVQFLSKLIKRFFTLILQYLLRFPLLDDNVRTFSQVHPLSIKLLNCQKSKDITCWTRTFQSSKIHRSLSLGTTDNKSDFQISPLVQLESGHPRYQSQRIVLNNTAVTRGCCKKKKFVENFFPT